MKNLIPSLLARTFSLALFSIVALTGQAQTSDAKIGYADVEYIFTQLPDAKVIESEMKATEAQLTTLINSKTEELKKKYAAYVEGSKTMLEPIRLSTERELQMLQENLEKLKQDAQASFEKKHQQLVLPVQQKIGNAISIVAKENDLTFVLTTRVGMEEVLLYKDEKADISDLVLKKMGVTPKPVVPTGTGPKK
jgi:outer membrane protein